MVEIDPSYSQDVEIDHDGVLRWVRDIRAGAIVSVPIHMLDKVLPGRAADDDEGPANCPVCNLLLDGDYCHQCERRTGADRA